MSSWSSSPKPQLLKCSLSPYMYSESSSCSEKHHRHYPWFLFFFCRPHFNLSTSTVDSTLKIYPNLSDLIKHKTESVPTVKLPTAFHHVYSKIQNFYHDAIKSGCQWLLQPHRVSIPFLPLSAPVTLAFLLGLGMPDRFLPQGCNSIFLLYFPWSYTWHSFGS